MFVFLYIHREIIAGNDKLRGDIKLYNSRSVVKVFL